MINETQLLDFPLTKALFEHVNRNFILFAKGYRYILETFDIAYLQFAEKLLTAIRSKSKTEENYRKCIKSFIDLSIHVLVLQQKLDKEGVYQCSSFEEANKNVYQDDAMIQYLDGLIISQILWPNHYSFGRYFIEFSSNTTEDFRILDAPSGEGIYSYYIAEHFRFKSLHSIDISPFSIQYTKELLKHADLDKDNINIELKSIYDLDEELKFDFISCGELLEHIENADTLLSKLHVLLKDTGTLFLTTAIFAAADDHILLFNNAEEVRTVLKEHFNIRSEIILPTSLEPFSNDMNKVPINYACFLGK